MVKKCGWRSALIAISIASIFVLVPFILWSSNWQTPAEVQAAGGQLMVLSTFSLSDHEEKGASNRSSSYGVSHEAAASQELMKDATTNRRDSYSSSMEEIAPDRTYGYGVHSTELVSRESERRNFQPRSSYHNWDAFRADFSDMLERFRVFVYPDVHNRNAAFANVFLPHPDPYNRKLGNYFSEHILKLNLLKSIFVTRDASEAHMFFLPFSINALWADARTKRDGKIAQFVAEYVQNVSREFKFWNRTEGADHFYACCHSVGRYAAIQSPSLSKNSVQVVCSSSYYLRGYAAHKDVAMPQVWPRSSNKLVLRPPNLRTRLAFYAGRVQNSRVRQDLVRLWKNDADMDIYPDKIRGSYEEAFQKTKFCLHVKGYEVNTARISDAIHFGCVPVIISDHYDLPFANVLDWKKFSIIISYADVPALKNILLSVTKEQYRELHENVCQIREHFQWHAQPSGYDSFHMTMYQLWLKRGVVRPPQTWAL